MRKESLKRDNTTDSSQGDNSDADDNEQSLSNGRNNDPSNGSNGDGVDPFDALVASKPPSSSKPNSVTAGNSSPMNSPASSPTNDGPNTTEGDGDAGTDGETAGDKADADGGYEVDEIVDHKYKGKSKKLYKIRWKNYGPDDDTWEPEESLSCPELIEKYLETHPDTRPPKKEKKPKKEKRAVDAVPRDVPKRVSTKSSIVESDDGGASVDSTKKLKKAGPQKNKKKPQVYEVEKIVEDRQGSNGETIFRIRWKGYRAHQDTWEPKASLSCNDLIKKYWATKKKTAKVEVDTTEYEVEKIVGHKVERGQVSYWVKWKGYGEDANTWEIAATVNCPDLIEQYKQKYFSAPATNGKTKSPAKRPAIDNKKNNNTPAKKKKKAPKIVPDDTDDDDDQDDEDDAAAVDDDADRDPLEDTTEKEWEVEDIVDDRTLKGKKEYLIRWKGCKADQDTWEPAQNVNCPDIIAKYEKKQKATTKKSSGEKQGKRVSIKLPSTPRKSSRRA